MLRGTRSAAALAFAAGLVTHMHWPVVHAATRPTTDMHGCAALRLSMAPRSLMPACLPPPWCALGQVLYELLLYRARKMRGQQLGRDAEADEGEEEGGLAFLFQEDGHAPEEVSEQA